MPLHHYLPASFLARFSADSKTEPARERFLVVGDKKNDKTFNAPAGKVGCIKNLYTLSDNSADPNEIDKTWSEYERKLPTAIDHLISRNIDAEIWALILVPFVSCMLVRGPDFIEKFNGRWPANRPEEINKILSNDNANRARLLDLQRLLGFVATAKWIVLSKYGTDPLITNDLGYSPFVHPQTGDIGMAIPLDHKTVLAIIPTIRDHPILREDANKWIPIIDYQDLPLDNHQGLNKSLALNALRLIFGSDESIIRKYIQEPKLSSTSPELEELGFPVGRFSRAHEFTWHRLVGAIKKPPSDKHGWEFPLDWDAITKGWHSLSILPLNLIEFPPALKREKNTISTRFYDPEIYYTISHILNLQEAGKYDSRNYDLAITEVANVLTQKMSSSNKARIYAIRGSILSDVEKHDEAIKDYEKAINMGYKNANILTDYGYALLKVEKAAKAFDILSKAIKLNPNHGVAYMNRSAALWKIGQPYKSIEDSTAAINLLQDGNERATAFYNRGNIYIELGLYQDAVNDFLHAISLHTSPNDKANCYVRQAIAFDFLNQKNQALDALNLAITLCPADYKILMSQVFFHFKHGNYTKALAEIDSALLHVPDSNTKAELLRQSAIQLAEASLYKEANKLFDSAILLASNKAFISYDKGCALLNQADITSAIDAFNLTIRHNPFHTKALNNLGICLTLQGKHLEAIKIFDSAIKSASDNQDIASINRNMAISLAIVGEFNRAEKALKKIKTIAPNEPRNLIVKGRVEFFRGNFQKAVEIYSTFPVGPSPFAAISLLALGNVEDALVIFKSWISTPQHPIEIFTIISDLRIFKERTPDAKGIEKAIEILS